MIDWQPQNPTMVAATMPNGTIFAGSTTFDPDAKQPFFWEVSSSGKGLPTHWGYADTLEEAKALAIANYVITKA